MENNFNENDFDWDDDELNNGIDDSEFDDFDDDDFEDDSDTDDIDFEGADFEGLDDSDEEIDSMEEDQYDEVAQNQDSESFITDHTTDSDVLDELDENNNQEYDLDTDDNISLADLESATLDEYSEGAEVDSNELLEELDESNRYGMIDNDFVSDSGGIVVQSNTDDEHGFEMRYIDIGKIAIMGRIRSQGSVDSLVQSIKSTGLLQPLTVAPTATEGWYVLLDGLRRIQACAKAGLSRIPCIVNNKVNTPEIPIIEAMYNHNKSYSIKEQISYIDYLEKQKGINNPTMIEYLLQMNNGDYSKLKDILNDDDEDIVGKLYDGTYDIATAFKKLEQRRKKESAEEKEKKKAEQVYGDEKESGMDQVQGAGDEGDGPPLTPDQVAELNINLNSLDDDAESGDLGEMLQEDANIEGFEAHKQKVGEREYIDPIIKKTVMARDNSTCRCCKRGGEQYVDILDFHHVLPVFLGGNDSPENGVMLCVSCHRLVHLYSTGDLHIPSELVDGEYDTLPEDKKVRYENKELFEDEKNRFKRIVILGSKIRKGIAAKGMNREQYKKEHSNNGIGRRKPGKNAPQEQA